MLHRDSRHGFLHPFLTPLLITLQLLQPLLFNAVSAVEVVGVVPTTIGTGLDQAANGVPIVNIAAPGAAGISQNSYAQFDVAQQGLILNNSAQPVNTQLGGYVLGNANMAAGAARLILNEVTSTLPSALNGYLEVAGAAADVIVANPNGISCNGCGFINTPQATLSTGQTLFAADGSIAGFAVENGVLRIDGAGLNADNTDQLALYTRVLELNAALYAQQLDVVTGANHIDAVTGAVTPIAPGTTTTPGYAIDSSLLGGMYANRIRLVGTEAGVGMRLAGPVAALTGSLEILANGDVRLARTSAATDLSISANGQLLLNDLVSAGGNADLQATTLDLVNTETTTAQLTSAAATLSANTVTTGTGSVIAARGDLAITAAQQHYDGNVGSAGLLTLTGSNIINTQQLIAGHGLTITADQLRNSGQIDVTQGAANVDLTGAFDNRDGIVRSGGDTLDINAATLDNRDGQIASVGMLGVQLSDAGVAAAALNNSNGLLSGNTALTIDSVGLNNSGGQILGNGAIDLNLHQSTLDNSTGLIDTTGSITLNNANALQNTDGILRAGADLTLYLPAFNRMQNGGTYTAGGLLGIHTAGDIYFGGDDFKTAGGLWLDAGTNNIRIDSRIEAGADSELTAQTINVGDDGFFAAQGALAAQAHTLNNLGVLYGRDALTLQIDNVLNNGDATAYRAAWLLSGGDISISNAAGTRLQSVNNYGGLIETQNGDIRISADTLNNINIGWAVLAPYDLPAVFTYRADAPSTPTQALWDTHYGCCESWSSGLRVYRDETLTTRNDVLSLGERAGIAAAGDIRLDLGVLNNDHSTVSAGNLLDIVADTIYNTGTALTDVTTVNTIARWHDCKKHSDGNTTCNNGEQAFVPLILATQPGDKELIPAVLEGKVVALHGTVINCDPAQAGINGTVCEAERKGSTANTDAGVFAGLPTAPPATTSASGAIAPGVLDPTALPGFNLPANGLFRLNTDPTHPYLIETDPALNTYTGFLGSGYLIDQLNWSPDITQQRLGDSYYELMLIRDVLLASIGSRFIDPSITDERAQFEFLMANSIAAYQALHLSPGVSLSIEQINALQWDIVWLEEKVVAGITVLVPVVYLAQNSARILTDGAVIGGGSVSIDGGTLTNSGLIRTQNDLQMDVTGDISNLGGTISAGGDLAMQAGGDILNESGAISGTNVWMEAEGDIIHRTWSETTGTVVDGNGSWSTRVGDTATVTATGNLIQIAGHDIVLEGASLSGGAVALSAGHDVILSTVQVDQGYTYASGGTQQSEEYTRQLGSQINALTDLLIIAENDITALAATLSANEDIALYAGNSISLLAAEETDHVESHTQDSGTFSDSSSDLVHDESRLVGSTITAGGNLTLNATQGDITLYASTATAGGTGDISAGGNINLIAGIDTTQHREQSSSSDLATWESHDEGYITQTAVMSGISTGGDLNLNAVGNVNVVASTLHSDNTLRIGDTTMVQNEDGTFTSVDGAVPANLNVTTLALTNETWNESSDGYSGALEVLADAVSYIVDPILAVVSAGQLGMPAIDTGTSSGVRTLDITQATSTLSAQNIDINVANTATFTGATVTAANNLSVSANDIVINAVAETHVNTFNTGSDNAHGSSSGMTESGSSTVLGSTFSAGGDMVLDASHDITFTAAELSAGGNVDLVAGNEIHYLTANDTTWSLSELHVEGALNREVSELNQVVDETVVNTTIQSGGNITAVSQNNQIIQAVRMESGGDLTLTSVNGKLIFQVAVETDSASYTRSDGDLTWQSAEGHGSTDETLQHSQLIAAGNQALNAAQGISIEIPEVNEQSVGQVIDAMVAANPDLAWLKTAEQNGDIDWQQVKELHESWQYDQQTLGEGAALAIVIAVTAFTGGAGATAANVLSTAATNLGMSAGVVAAAGSSVVAAASGAIITGATSQVVLGTINNGGNFGEAISSLDTQESVEGLVVAGLTAGLTAGFVDPVFDNYADGAIVTDTRLQITQGFNLNDLHDIGGFIQHAGMQALVQAGVQSAVLGGSFDDYLDDALNAQGASVLSALAFNQVGNLASSLLPRDAAGNLLPNASSIWAEGGGGRVLLHTLTGGLVAEATGGDFETGAAAAGLQQFLSPALDHLAGVNDPNDPDGGNQALRATGAQLTGLVGAALVDGDLNQGVAIALAADTYNRRLHTTESLILADRIKADPENARRWQAAACALTSCSAGVPASDPNYAALVALEAEGQLYQAELANLEATGQFTRSTAEVAADLASAYGREVALAGGAGGVVIGAGTAVLSGLGAAAGCVATAGVACAATVGLGALGVAGGVDMYSDGLDQLNAPFVSTEGDKVLASFDPATHPGDTDPYADLGGFVVDLTVDLTIDRLTGHALDRLLGSSALPGVTALDDVDVGLPNQVDIGDTSSWSSPTADMDIEGSFPGGILLGGVDAASAASSGDGATAGVFDTGANITPMSTANAYQYIGANGTYVTPLSSIESVTGPISPTATAITITPAQASTLETSLGLMPGSLESSNVLSIVNNVSTRAPRSPLAGNSSFLGAGQGLPGGGSELVIDAIPSAGGQGIQQITVNVR